MRNSYWLGVDLSKEKFHAAIASLDSSPSGWASLPNAEFENSPAGIDALCAWTVQQGVFIQNLLGICVEATGRYAWAFVSQLDGRLAPVSIVNPARPVAFAKSMGLRDKTDRVDACILALYGVAHKPNPTAVPTSLQQQLRELTAHYAQERRELTACHQRLSETIASTLVRKQLIARTRAACKRIEAIEQELDRLIAEDPAMQRDAVLIQSIPGVAAKTCRIILAEFGDLRRYSRNELVALAGVFPKQFSSGKSVHRKPRMAKCGGRRVRAALYMAVLSARRYCPQLKSFSARLKSTGKHNAQIHGAAMRKLLLLIRAVVVNNTPYSPNYELQ
jgi:transposase